MIRYNPHRWLDHLFDVEGSMVREITGRVSFCAVWATAVVVVHKYVHPASISPLIHTLVGVAIGLLLVFRTNASYDRYWEGRRLWGAIVNECRNLGREACVLLAEAPALLGQALDWTAAFPYAVKQRLRHGEGLDAGPLSLTPEAAAEVSGAEHVPLAVALRLTRVFDQARRQGLISDYLYGSLDGGVGRLIDALGACERIHTTPLPFVYVVHLRRALILYCCSLPFTLVEPFGWGAIVATVLVSYMFFGIEEIGVEIEDPFGGDSNDLPLDAYCERIEANMTQLRTSAPAPVPLPTPADGVANAL